MCVACIKDLKYKCHLLKMLIWKKKDIYNIIGMFPEYFIKAMKSENVYNNENM